MSTDRVRWYQRSSPTRRVAALIGLLAALNLAIVIGTWGEPPIVSGVELSPLLLVVMFAFVEWRVIHIQFRAEASSFSLLEVPLVLGVLFVPPYQLVLAAMVGMLIGLSLGRRQRVTKLVFNAVNVGLYGAVAWVVIDMIGPHDELGRAVWLSVFAATAAGTVLTVSAILAAITLTEGPPSRRAALRLIGFANAMAATNTALGLVAAMLLPDEALGIVLLLVPAAMVLLAFQMLASERAQRERVEFLLRSSRLLDADQTDRGPIAVLEASREMFRADTAALVFLPDGDTAASALLLRDDGPTARDLSAPQDLALLVDAFAAVSDATLVDVVDDDPAARLIRHLGGRDAIVAPLATEERDLGLLLVANRLGEASGFTRDDVHVFDALAAQSAVLLHNDRLEQALAELQTLERELAHQVTHDALTDLPNRSLFTSRLDEVAAGTEPFAVLFVDLDDFKLVNDTRGHSDGDAVLVEVANRIREVVRPIDTAARLGGDEFAVLVRDHAYPCDVANRIVASISEPIEVGPEPVHIGCSVGVATATGSREPGEMLRRADLAMYEAKQQGKRGVVEYVPEFDGANELGFKAALRNAITAGELELHYQPIVDPVSRQVRGLEALVRWRSRDHGLLLPESFIAQAERDGFIVPIDRWVLERTVADLDTLRSAGHRDLFVCVNLSARHLQAPDLVEHVAAHVPRVPAGRRGPFVFEVTETALMSDVARSRSNIEAIRDLGVQFALDDFGTGYSSIGYLRDFDIDLLKIAREFVEEATSSPDDRNFLAAMIDLGHALDLTVVGEGVETTGQADVLRHLGCDYAQGYLYARPMPIDRLLTSLERQSTTAVVPLTLR